MKGLSRRWIVVAALGLVQLGAAPAPGGDDPLSEELKTDFENVRDYIMRSAEKMPEAKYAFKPSPEVRTFGQILAHVADDQYNLCAPVKSEKRHAAYTAIEDSLSRKADLVAALKDAFAYCEPAYAAMPDRAGAERSAIGPRRTKFSMLNWNVWHTWEHYGNLVVYLRINGVVPPSSEGMQHGK